MTLIEIARLFLFVREAAPNKGQRVEAIQRWSGGAPGDSWCCEWATMVLDLAYQGASPIPRAQACQDVLDEATQQGWLVSDPEPEDLFLYVNDAGHAHHIGFITASHPLTGIAANTSKDGLSSNGDGVYEHYLIANPARVKFVRLPQP